MKQPQESSKSYVKVSLCSRFSIDQNDKEFIFSNEDVSFSIDKSDIIAIYKSNEIPPMLNNPDGFFYLVKISRERFSKYKLHLATYKAKIKRDLIIHGEVFFGILWDRVRYRNHKVSKHEDRRCFYCNCKITKGKATKDHLIPRSIVSVYMPVEMPFNKVTCCIKCNSHKSNLHPSLWLTKLRKNEFPNRSYIISTLEYILKDHGSNIQSNTKVQYEKIF